MPGPLGTPTNSPIPGGSTSPLTQYRPPVPQGHDTKPKKKFHPTFHPGSNHGHLPSGRWSEVQAEPNSGLGLNLLCERMDPSALVAVAFVAKFLDKPIARAHLDFYLEGKGKGAHGTEVMFDEDHNIHTWLMQEKGVKAALVKQIPTSQKSGKFAGSIRFEQEDYAEDDTGQDFRFAWGAIDRLDFEVDFDAKTVHVWFQDRYEWHPYYPGIYAAITHNPPEPEDDEARETNCLHAALVELKSEDAADFWMKGKATVPLTVIIPSKKVAGTHH
jgi:hypothetical protein